MKIPYLMHTVDQSAIEFVAGEGARLLDSKGNEYLDFFADSGAASLGYGANEHASAIDQAMRLGPIVHVPNIYQFKERNEAAEALCKRTNMDGVFFSNSGAEAVETAMKIARKWQWLNRPESYARTLICSYEGGFHGRTYGALAASFGPEYYYEGFGALPTGFGEFSTIREIPTNAAAVMLSPVFCNHDVFPYNRKWLQKLRDYTQMHGIILIFDEIQTAPSRCGGDILYSQLLDIQPDIVTLAKGIGCGYPIAATLARGDLAHVLTPGTHFTTFGGNPMGCIFVKEMLGYLDDRAIAGIVAKGERMRQAFTEKGFDNIGVGMLNAFTPKVDAMRLARKCRSMGLLLGAFRSGLNPIRITPPLNITHEELDYGLDTLFRAHECLYKQLELPLE